jgi:hypothetical protein
LSVLKTKYKRALEKIGKHHFTAAFPKLFPSMAEQTSKDPYSEQISKLEAYFLCNAAKTLLEKGSKLIPNFEEKVRFLYFSLQSSPLFQRLSRNGVSDPQIHQFLIEFVLLAYETESKEMKEVDMPELPQLMPQDMERVKSFLPFFSYCPLFCDF